MIYDKLKAKVFEEYATTYEDLCGNVPMSPKALLAVVELHKPWNFGCSHCINIEGGYMSYPCPTIRAIEKELE